MDLLEAEKRLNDVGLIVEGVNKLETKFKLFSYYNKYTKEYYPCIVEINYNARGKKYYSGMEYDPRIGGNLIASVDEYDYDYVKNNLHSISKCDPELVEYIKSYNDKVNDEYGIKAIEVKRLV